MASEKSGIPRELKLQIQDCESVLNNKLKINNFKIINYEIISLKNVLGFFGEHKKIKIIYFKNQKKVEVIVFGKFFPRDHLQVDYELVSGAFTKEIFVYNFIFKRIEKTGIDLLNGIVPRCYFTKENSVLIFEDLTLKGFKSLPRYEYLDLEHIVLIIKTIAKLHACSLVYELKQSESFEKYFANYNETFYSEKEVHKGRKSFFASLKAIKTEIDYFNLPSVMTNAQFKDAADVICKKIFDLVKPSAKHHNVLTHGDLWSTNILMKYANQKPIQGILLDFQLSRFVPPSQDLLGFLYFSTSRSFRQTHMDELIKIYYNELNNLVSLYGFDLASIISMNDFKESCEEQKIFAFVQMATYYQMIQVKSEYMDEAIKGEKNWAYILYEDRSQVVLDNCRDDENYRRKLKDTLENLKEVCEDYVLNKYIVASRDIKQGELILKETPTVVGPQIEAAPLCLNCYRPIDPLKIPITCQRCKIAPFCNLNCNEGGHHEDECNLFKSNNKITTQELIQNCQILMPLRCLLLRKNHPLLWETLMELESHVDKRKDTPIWRKHKIHVEDIIKNFEVLEGDDLKDELIQKVCGILDVNTFELRAPGFGIGSMIHPSECIRGLYVQAALMAHDCIGNTHLAVDDNYNLLIHSSVPISKGEAILFNYTSALQGTHERREHLKEGKYFSCACSRCNDPTELGTHLSSLKCAKCYDGFVIPVNPIGERYQHNSFWKCHKEDCAKEYRGTLVHRTIQESHRYAENLDKSDIRSVENGIKKLQLTLADEHSLILDLKQCLIGIYSEIIRREPHPNRKYLNRKQELCSDILPVLKKVEPGISRLKGITLYEMHIPKVISSNRAYENKEITAEKYLEILLECEGMLKESINILLYEPNESPEGRLRAKAMNELKFLRNSIHSVQMIVQNKKENVDKKKKKNKHK